MQKVTFKELYLLSKKENSAKKILFDPKKTIILGVNDTGKSSLIKSIYHTLGGDISFHKKWVNANVIGLLKILIGVNSYFILRYQNVFAIFLENNNVLSVGQGIGTSKGISKSLADLFDFHLKLKMSSNNSALLATPAFQYLPFYIDQDKGWLTPWSSFEGLQQFSSWKRDLIDYHTGLKPKEYYNLSERIIELDLIQKEKDAELKVIKNAQKQIEDRQKKVLFDIDVESYKKEIDNLLTKCEVLNVEQEKYRNELNTLKNKENTILHQLDLAKKSLSNVDKDYEFILKNYESDKVECPLCGSEFENSLIYRFSLVEDAESCREIIVQLNKDLIEIRETTKVVSEKYFKNKESLNSIQNLLEEKRGNISLSDLIKSESRKEISNTFSDNISVTTKSIDDAFIEMEKLKKARKKLTDKKRILSIKNHFSDSMTKNLATLAVFGLTEKDYKDIPTSVKESGSDHPRALLAYYYSILDTMKKYSSSTIFPLIIDSPNQQDQDKLNLSKIMQFALNEMPLDNQLILGSVELYGIETDGLIINLKNKHHLLDVEEYDEVDSFVSPYFNKMLNALEYEK